MKGGMSENEESETTLFAQQISAAVGVKINYLIIIEEKKIISKKANGVFDFVGKEG